MISDARGSHVSPGIYTEEKDVTYSVKSLGITSLGLVGETLYGPAFSRIDIENWGEYVDYFGGTSTEKFSDGTPKYQVPYVAKSYLEESKRLSVVRVLGLSGYNAGPAWAITAGKDNKKHVIAVLRSKMVYDDRGLFDICDGFDDTPTQLITGITIGSYTESIKGGCPSNSTSANVNENVIKFSITAKGKGIDVTYNVTLNPSDSNYIYKVLSNTPNGKTPIYIDAVYESSIPVGATITTGDCTACSTDEYKDFKSPFRCATTPWIVSDVITYENASESLSQKTSTMKKLFRFITISDGDAANFQVKVSIQNITPSNGSFDVVVRDFNDTDANPIILERFVKCNLIEGDANYIAFRIGSSDGGYVAKSKYILVEMSDKAADFGTAFPAGFLGYPMPKYGDTNESFHLEYNTKFRPEVKAKKQYFGMSNLAGKYGIDRDILSFKGAQWYLEGPENLCNGFHMDSSIENSNIFVDGITGYTFSHVSSDKVTYDEFEPRLINDKTIENTIYKDINVRKFTVCFCGGFDGWDINRPTRTNTDEFKATQYNGLTGQYKSIAELDINLDLPSTAITSDYYAYLAACRVFSNPQDIDINIFATPGIDWANNTLLTEEIIDMIEDKDGGRGGDALYVMSSPNDVDTNSIVDRFLGTGINSSYACTYFPWVMYYDNANKRYLELPATKDVVRNMAHTDNTSFPWFAPAGMLRGNVDCIKATFKTTLADEDALYEVGINPIKSYAQDGVKVWGNKTTYDIESPLNRINVRRLAIRVKKLITEAAKHLIFEQYDETLEAQFKGIVEPILADVKSNRGIIDYRVITECTPETRDQHILPAKILVKPTQSLEYISISFVVYPESVNFED
jgi:hypothetical protein